MTEPHHGFFSYIFAQNEGMRTYSFLAAGMAGSIISMQFIEGMTARQRISAVVTGVILADQFAHPLANLLGAGDYAFGAAGMIGLFGFSTCGAVIKGIKESNLANMLQDFVGAIAARITGGK